MVMTVNCERLQKMITEDVVEKIVDAIYNAVTTDIAEDLQRAGLYEKTSNSVSQRIWDLINRNITNIQLPNLITGYTHRNPWNIVTAFDKSTAVLYSFMREARFKEIAKHQQKHVHYLQALTSGFNNDVEVEQMSFFSEEQPDQFEVARTIHQIVEDLNIPETIVRGHVLILFESKHEILHGVRACLVNGDLDICASIDLSHLIAASSPVVVDEAVIPESKANDSAQKLRLTPKAKKRKNMQMDLALALKKKQKEEQSTS